MPSIDKYTEVWNCTEHQVVKADFATHVERCAQALFKQLSGRE